MTVNLAFTPSVLQTQTPTLPPSEKKKRKGNLRPTPTQALEEQVRREMARRQFVEFCSYVDEKFEAAPHVALLCEKLQEVARYIETGGKRGIGRLMIFMPPRHGKSELASRKFPAFLLGRHPDSRIILTSYGADLASRNSRDVRELVTSPKYQALFGVKSSSDAPVALSSDSRSISSWDLAQPHLGGVIATGVGGGITGLGADLLVLDDPYKNREEAESEGRRDLIDDWWKSSARTRLSPRGAVIVFHTRWHPDDQAGRLLRRMIEEPMSDQWDVVCLPALALDEYPTLEDREVKMRDGVYLPLVDPLGRTNGSALWPSHYNEESLISTRLNVGEYDFEALYQQMPYPKSGQKYRREWFKTVTQLPEGVTIKFLVRYWDKANSINGDFTVGVLMAYCSDGYFYILDVVRGRWSSYERDRMMKSTAEKDEAQTQLAYKARVAIWHQQDPGSAGKDSAEATNRLLMGHAVKFEPVTGDKETRSSPLESALQGGLVFLMKAAWNQDFIDECIAFPRGRHDDQVDAASSAYNKLIFMIATRRKSNIG